MSRESGVDRSFVMRWTRMYTAGLPTDVRDERRAELSSEVFEERADAGSTPSTDRAIRWRTIRGMSDDVAWRLRERHKMRANEATPTLWRTAWATLTQAWFTPVAALVGGFNLVLGLGIITNAGGDSTMPGRVIGPMLLFAFAASMFLGLHVRRLATLVRAVGTAAPEARGQAAHPRRYVVAVVLLAGSVSVAVVWGGGAGLPPVAAVVGLGIVASAWALRSSRRRPVRASAPRAGAAGDVLLVLGSLPSLAFFWMVVPPILAVAVIAGAVGVGPSGRGRRAAS